MELFWYSLDIAPLSIVFYLEIKVEVEVGVHDIRSRFTLRQKLTQDLEKLFYHQYSGTDYFHNEHVFWYICYGT